MRNLQQIWFFFKANWETHSETAFVSHEDYSKLGTGHRRTLRLLLYTHLIVGLVHAATWSLQLPVWLCRTERPFFWPDQLSQHGCRTLSLSLLPWPQHMASSSHLHPPLWDCSCTPCEPKAGVGNRFFQWARSRYLNNQILYLNENWSAHFLWMKYLLHAFAFLYHS